MLVVVGGLAGAVALRASKQAPTAARRQAPPRSHSSSARAISPMSRARPLSRWLAVSGTLQPVRQAIVKAKVAGDVRRVHRARRRGGRAGQMSRASTRPTSSRGSSIASARWRARVRSSRWPRRRATMNVRLLNDKFISQNAFDSAESSFNVAQGNVKSAEAQVQLAQNALRDAQVTRRCRASSRSATCSRARRSRSRRRSSRSSTSTDLEVQAMVPAIDVPELRVGMPVELTVDGFGERRFQGRVERINPSTEPGTRAILVYVSCPTPTPRCAAACSRPAASRSPPARRRPRCRLPPCAARRGRASCGRSMTASSRGASCITGRRDDDERPHRDQDCAARAGCRCWPRGSTT